MTKRDTVSTVYCIVPVHNRFETTKSCIEFLSQQSYEFLRTVIIDDGSTDGTAEYLSGLAPSICTVIKGDGDLWWGGAMALGIDFFLDTANESDYLLMLNDDVRVDQDYVATLVQASKQANDSMVGSAFCDADTSQPVGFGSRVDYLKMSISAITASELASSVNILPGRGVLIPGNYVRRAGNIRTTLFPHYFGDIEYTARVHELGCNIVVCEKAKVFASVTSSDLHIRNQGFLRRYFSWMSKDNIVHRLLFFSVRGPWLLRLIAIPRYAVVIIARRIWDLFSR